ncbi:MAG: biotin--[acetyl-CoA-carboxylase] ligase [Lentisphaerae bacterium]|nr:biotin--[acetyl-CoA-carboxylase] ligase [Lentisphaerota bacterium]
MDEIGENCNLIVLQQVDSTNTYAKNHFDTLPDLSVIAAIEQTAGRGRLGRKWVTPPESALTASAVLKNIKVPFHAGVITGLAGLELVREQLPDKFCFFKWPNDIYIKERKIAGILSEGVLKNGRLAGVVSGIGINVNQSAEDMRLLDNPATSLCAESGKKFFLEKLRLELAEKIKKYYIMYQSNSEAVLGLWRDENRLIGETLFLNMPDGTVRQGCFTGIGENGEMMLCTPDGGDFRFDCGDVKIDASLIDFNLLSCKHKQGSLR